MVAVANKPKRKRKIVLGPKDHGRKLSLDEFDTAITPAPGLYELNKGVVEVSEVPSGEHADIVQELRDGLTIYRVTHPGRVFLIAGGSDAKVLLDKDKSERHPDLSVYLTARPPDLRQPWAYWTPEIVVEVVSVSSRKRDYDVKPDEYRTAGVLEYWIVDPASQTITVKTRWRGLWKDKILKPGRSYETRFLPGFKLNVRKVLAAGK